MTKSIATKPATTSASKPAATPQLAASPKPPQAAQTVAGFVQSLTALFKSQTTDAMRNTPYDHAYFNNAATRALIAWGQMQPGALYPDLEAGQPANLKQDNFFANLPVSPAAYGLLTAAFALYSAFVPGQSISDTSTALKALSDQCYGVKP